MNNTNAPIFIILLTVWCGCLSYAIDAPNWKRLRIEMPGPMDTATASGMAYTGHMESGALVDNHLVRTGGWFKINIHSANRKFEQMVPFDGTDKHWKFSMDGHRMLLSRDGASPEVVGLTLLETLKPEQWFTSSETAPFAKAVSVELQEVNQAPLLLDAPIPISAILTPNFRVTDSDLKSIAAINPRALAIDLDYQLADSLSYFDGCRVEAWSLELVNEPYKTGGSNGRKILPYPLTLPSLPNIKFFNLFFEVTPTEIYRELTAKAPNLLVLSVSARNLRSVYCNGDEVAGLTKLESLCIFGTRISPWVFMDLPNLRAFHCYISCVDINDPQIKKWSTKKGLVMLRLQLGSFPDDTMKAWAASGNLSNLAELQNFRDSDTSQMPHLEIFNHRRGRNGNKDLDIEKLGGLKKLRSIFVQACSQEEIEAIAVLPNANRIEQLYLRQGKMTDLSPLSSLTNLTRLELLSLNPTESVKSINLHNFPKLEVFRSLSCKGITSIEGIPDHPNLLQLEISSNLKLETIGDDFSDSKLQSIKLVNQDLITDLSPLDKAPALKYLHLSSCEKLTNPLGIDLENFDWVKIEKCPGLTSVFPLK